MGHAYTNLLVHLVFSTKDRQPTIKEGIRSQLHQYIGGIVRSQGGIALAVNGTSDHIHILAKLRQDRNPSDLIREIKVSSSKWIHQSFTDFAWQSGYGAFSVSVSQVERVQHYISNQDEHHKKVRFEDEFKALLQAHKIEFSEEYLWK